MDLKIYNLEDESLEDIIMQIWNDGAEGIIYENADLKEFEGRLRNAVKREEDATVDHGNHHHGEVWK